MANLSLVLGNDITSSVAIDELDKVKCTKIFDKDKTGGFLRIQAGKWGNSGSNGVDVTLNASNQEIEVDIYVDSISTLTMKLSNGSKYTGTINGDKTAKSISLSLDSTSSINHNFFIGTKYIQYFYYIVELKWFLVRSKNMSDIKKAIVLDMDETLECGVYDPSGGTAMILRPNLDMLIAKLVEAKKQGVGVILCTTAKDVWVNRFLALKPEFKEIFDRIFTWDNQSEWNDVKKDENPEEYEARQQSPNLYKLKPVTTFGYNSVLYIDDNLTDFIRLEELFELAQGRLNKEVVYFSGFGFYVGMELTDYCTFRSAASHDPSIAEQFEEYVSLTKNEPGCSTMCDLIDTFISKPFTPGVTKADEELSPINKKYFDQTWKLKQQLKDATSELEKRTGKKFFGNTQEKKAAIKRYLSKDRAVLYEGFEFGSDSLEKEGAKIPDEAKLEQ